VTAGREGPDAAGMARTTTAGGTGATRRGRASTAGSARGWALVSGGSGVLANVALVLFFALTRPWSGQSGGPTWLGPAADVIEVVQFAAFVPVVLAVHRRLPASRTARLGRAAGATAAGAVAVLQVLLLLDAVPADAESLAVLAAAVALSLWILAVGLVGHRTARLPRPVTRCAVLLGPAMPLGAAVAGAGWLTAGPVGPALVVVGAVVGAAGWLALPVFPLFVARHLIPKETS
jgi:hypothetical protein